MWGGKRESRKSITSPPYIICCFGAASIGNEKKKRVGGKGARKIMADISKLKALLFFLLPSALNALLLLLLLLPLFRKWNPPPPPLRFLHAFQDTGGGDPTPNPSLLNPPDEERGEKFLSSCLFLLPFLHGVFFLPFLHLSRDAAAAAAWQGKRGWRPPSDPSFHIRGETSILRSISGGGGERENPFIISFGWGRERGERGGGGKSGSVSHLRTEEEEGEQKF